VVLVFGNGLATSDIGRYISDHWADLPRTVAAGAVIAATCASVSLAIASQTHRRAYATVAVVAWFLVVFPIANILLYSIGGAGTGAIFLSAFDFLHGSTLFIFDKEPGFDTSQEVADFPMWTYLACAFAYFAAGVAVVVRRFDRIAA
jgi:hypothetical protein